jgi:hypothetical protein
MDANGLHFWLLGADQHWPARSHLTWDKDCGLRLASERRLPELAASGDSFAAANSALEQIPRALDSQGGLAYWKPAANAVVARSHLPDEAISLGLDTTPTDLLVGYDGVLYCALPDAIRMHDLRGRWADQILRAPGFSPWRLAAVHPNGGVWALDRSSGRLARVTGAPLALGPNREYAGGVFRPSPENCHPPVLELLPPLDWPAGERPLALASHAESGLALLSWAGAGNARVRRYDSKTGRLGPALALTDARYAYALAWLDAGRVAVRLVGRNDAPVFELAAADENLAIFPAGEIYPLSATALEAPFAHRLDGPPRYPVAIAPGVRGSEPLYPLSFTNLARRGEARNFRANDGYLLDSGSPSTVWHRLYAEASLPPRTGFVVWLTATAEPKPPTDDAAWMPHRFGEFAEALPAQTPQAAWENAASELPHHSGLGSWAHEPGRAGLLSVLIQNPSVKVRALVGRYLWVRVVLAGDGRVSPAIAALRA